MMMALGIENDIDGLRYSKIIATDADNDGFHIRNLLLTFFQLLRSSSHQRVYILETPLFRVRNKRKPAIAIRRKGDAAVKRLGSSAEVTRFKGLGEISPKEFGQFIGANIRLLPVSAPALKNVPQILEFYMGKNTPDRREYIMKNLLAEVDV